MNKCPNCNAEITTAHTFCTTCGAKIPEAASQIQHPPSFYSTPAPAPAPAPTHMPAPAPQTAPYPQKPYAPVSYSPQTPPKPKSKLWLYILIGVLILALIGGFIFLLLRSRKIEEQAVSLAQTSTAVQSELEIEANLRAMKQKTLEAAQVQTQLPEPTPTIDPAINEAIFAEQTATALAIEAQNAQMQATQTQEAYSIQQTSEALSARQTRTAAQAAEEQAILNLIPEEERWRLDSATKVTTNTYQEEVYVTDGWLEDVRIAENLKNFVLTATFDNPANIRTNDYWEMGILFRSKAANDQLRLFVTVPDYWELSYVGGSGGYWSTVRGWRKKIDALDMSEGGSNTITLISNGQTGAFYVNGVFIDTLDLSSRPNYGGINLWIDYNTKSRDGEKTIFRDIHIWDLD